MEKRFIVAIILVFIVLFIMPQLFRPKTPPLEEESGEVQKRKPADAPPGPKASPEEPLPQVPEETIITVQTPLYEIQLTTRGARATSWRLNDYFERIREPEREPIDLIPLTAKECLAMRFDDFEIQDEMENVTWTPDKRSVAISDEEGNFQDSIKFHYTHEPTGVTISKEMTFFRDSYVVDVDIGFHNPSSENTKLGGYSFCWGEALAKDEVLSDMELAGEGPMAFIKTEKGAKLVKHWDRTGFGCIGGGHRLIGEQDAPVSWVGFASKYFAAVLIPGPWWSEEEGRRYELLVNGQSYRDTVQEAIRENRPEDIKLQPKEVWRTWGTNTTVALVVPGFSIAAGKSISHSFRVYVGPKKWDILRGIQGRDGSTESLGLGKMLNFGMFSPLGKAALWLLKVFHSVVGNYGLAIIFLALLIKLVYLPLTQKSFKSMKKMQELQPKVAALKDKYRDDPQRLQKETMKMYKQHGASPMGGCLPMVFQIPVFIALFATLRGAVELRGAVFIPGWITDLALPDTVARIAGFPIRILPLLMTGSMLLQQLIFGTGGGRGSGQSNKMMAFMPLIFAVFFYGMPSGLVLYWTCNNILAIGHQYLIRRQENTDSEDQEENKGEKTRNTRKGK